jgi:hypothetical protein
MRKMVEVAAQQWQYKLVEVSLNGTDPEKVANDLGSDCWELVGIRNHGNTMEVTLYFKRPWRP